MGEQPWGLSYCQAISVHHSVKNLETDHPVSPHNCSAENDTEGPALLKWWPSSSKWVQLCSFMLLEIPRWSPHPLVPAGSKAYQCFCLLTRQPNVICPRELSSATVMTHWRHTLTINTLWAYHTLSCRLWLAWTEKHLGGFRLTESGPLTVYIWGTKLWLYHWLCMMYH